jgi:hypothetical protein
MARPSPIPLQFKRALGSLSFRWFLSCTFISSVGRNGYAVACAWILVRSEAGSAAVATFVAIISLTELLVSPVAGWVCDRCSRRFVFIAADVARAFIAGMLILSDQMWVIWLSAMLFASCDRIALTSSQAMIPSVCLHLTPGTANSISFFSMQAGGLVAAALVGILLHGFSAMATFAAIGAAFVISACSMLLVANDNSHCRSGGSETSSLLKMNARFIHLGANFALLYGGGVLVSILGAGFVLDEMSGTALDFGQLESAWSAGSIIGVVLLIPVAGYAKRPVLLSIILGLIAVLFASLKLSTLPWTLATFAALGALYNLGRVAIEVTLQATIPHSALGRAKGIFHCAGVSVGLMLFGVVSLSSGRLQASTVFLLYAGVMVASTAILAAMRPRAGKAD